MRRRLAEANMFLHGQYSEYAPESYCYVLYDANGGVRDASAQGYDANMHAVPLSRPTYEGYAFVGWYTDKVGGVKITTLDETTHGMTLYAHWEENHYQADTPMIPTEGVEVTVTSAVVHVRSGPGMAYGVTTDVYASDKLTIIGTTRANGMLWGLCSQGWICLDHTNYQGIVGGTEEEAGEKLPVPPMFATVIHPSGVTVYSGPHTTYPQVKNLAQDQVIQLEEVILFAGKVWGRYADGWVRLSNSILLHDENTLAHSFKVITTTPGLTVRSGPGTSYDKVTNLPKGESYSVYALALVDGSYWGRIYEGWICLDYTNFDVSKLDQYQHHAYGEWYNYTASTCVTTGEQRRDCQYCNAYERREAEFGDHSMGEWTVIQPATCVADGAEQRVCQHCGHIETRMIPSVGHSMGQWAVTQEATCVADGAEQRICQHCDYSETRVITATGHTMGDWVVTKEATVEANGEESRRCQHCDHAETRVLVYSEHNFGQWYTTQEATCTQVGQERRDCADCDYYELRERSALGHSLGEWYTGQEPGCTEKGQERRDCVRCDHYETRPLDAVGHSYGEWYESIPATYTENGQERRDCVRCDHYETRQTDKLPIPTVTRTYATITCDSLRIRSGPGTGYKQVGKLYRGAEVEILEITAVGNVQWGRIEAGWICLTDYTTLRYVEDSSHTEHSYGDWYVSQAPTCTADGQERRDCQYCAHSQIRALNAAGHSFGQWYETVAATTTTYGQEQRDCQVCGHSETRQTDMLKTEMVEKVYATITYDYVTIRKSASTSSAKLGKLQKGAIVEILEQKTVGKNVWGRISMGWICLTGHTSTVTVTEEVAEQIKFTTMTVNTDNLKIRAGAGTSFSIVGYLYKGTV
ncbi:MAG: SH3 domain-containing protein, partial [Oscillospiraceae bacterium]|nr:SH3 domain-containing protein [Oscillospiraceae bacterium]